VKYLKPGARKRLLGEVWDVNASLRLEDEFYQYRFNASKTRHRASGIDVLEIMAGKCGVARCAHLWNFRTAEP